MKDNNELYTVYKITCLQNGKVYIGSTSRTAEERFNEHWHDHLNVDKKHRPLYQDMSVFGRNAFVVEEIESGLSSEGANFREDYWIEKSRSDNYDLYNQIGGGGGIRLSEEQEEKIAQLYKEGLSTPEIAEIVGRSYTTIWNVLNRNGIEMRDAGSPKKKVFCIETGEIYQSVYEAARQLGLNQGNISNCCLRISKSAGCLHFCFEEDREDFVIQEPKVDLTPKGVMCIETEVIYPSVHEAARQLGLNASGISKCCNGKLNSTGRKHFRFI